MNFTEAVEAMKRGKKVKLKHWDNIDCLYLDKTRNFTKSLILGGGTTRANVSMGEVESTDWEIVEEPKKTLWNKRQREDIPKTCSFFEFFHVEDVEVALREFHKWINIETVRDKNCNIIVHIDDVDSKLKEIFGEELVK